VAIIPQPQLVAWDQVEAASDVDRLQMLVEALPDEDLMRTLEAERKGKRDDYPIRAVWNSLLAGIVFQHRGVESLRRELQRNAQLRQGCGFDVFRGANAVPPEWVYTRFGKKLWRHRDAVERMIDRLIEELAAVLPDLGRRLAVDSKALASFAKPPRRDAAAREPDGRRDLDADWGTKTYQGVREDGTVWEKITHWFGYKRHLLVDAVYERPLVETLGKRHPPLVERAQYLSADKAYDSKENNQDLFDAHGIRPLIAIRATWKEEPDRPRPLYPRKGS